MSEKILIIDDEQDIADLLEVYLKYENYIVYKFYSSLLITKFLYTCLIDQLIINLCQNRYHF